MALGRFLVVCLSVLLLTVVFLVMPVVTRASSHERQECIDNAKWWYSATTNDTTNLHMYTTAFIKAVLDEADHLKDSVPHYAVEAETALNRYNADPSSQNRQLAWEKFNRFSFSLTQFSKLMGRGYNYVLTPCLHPRSTAIFEARPSGLAIRRRLETTLHAHSENWPFLDVNTAKLADLRKKMPSFLDFGIFEYPLPGITGTIDRFVKNPNPIIRYMNIVITMVIAGIVAIGLISIVVAGYMYVTAGGNAQRVTAAKSLIGAALLGIILALGAFLILNTIGTQFASGLQEPTIPAPSP